MVVIEKLKANTDILLGREKSKNKTKQRKRQTP
jgi:hypothetical protein